ncbi:MAG: cupredoxin domain-containing protein [Bacillota bacterium]|nr:cupredoxin domain-containing protein [Bacillota bacterium]
MNILSIITIVIVTLISGYSIYIVHKNKNMIKPMSGMLTGIAVAMMTALLSGYLIGILTGDIFLSGSIGVTIGFFIGFLIGQPIALMAILAGALSGILGGAVGAILGIIFLMESPFIMLGILLGLYIIIAGLVILFIKAEMDERLIIDTQAISPFSIFAAGVIIVSLFLFLYSSHYINEDSQQTQANESSPGETNTSITTLDLSKETSPKIKMEATSTGYSPSIIYVKRGANVELQLHNSDPSSCTAIFNLPDFNINNVSLKVGTTSFTFTPSKTGEYTFSCGMNMFKGKIIVE